MTRPNDLALAAVQAAVAAPQTLGFKGEQEPEGPPTAWGALAVPIDHPPANNLFEIGRPGDARADEPGGSRRPIGGGLALTTGVVRQPVTVERPDTGSTWGRTDTIAASDSPHEMARVILDSGEALTLTITTTAAPGVGKVEELRAIVSVPLYIWAAVTYGAGSTSTTRPIRCDDYLSVPVVACYLQVRVYIGDATGKPVMDRVWLGVTPSGQVNVQVARGVRGLPSQATMFKAAAGVNFSLGGPMRLASITSHLSAASDGVEQYLQLFDTADNPVADGTVPDAEYSLGSLPESSDVGDVLRWLNPRGFGQGVQVAVSTTSGVLTTSTTSAWCEIEIVQL